MDPLSTPGGRIELILLCGQWFLRYGPIFKIPYLGMKPGIWKKLQNLHMDPSSTPGGRNWAYFRSTGSGFWDTGHLSKLPYLGMKPGIWKKVPEVAYGPSFYPRGSKLSLFFALRAVVSEIKWSNNFENTIFEHETWNLKKVPEVALSTLWGRNWAYFRSTGSGLPVTAIFTFN